MFGDFCLFMVIYEVIYFVDIFGSGDFCYGFDFMVVVWVRVNFD